MLDTLKTITKLQSNIYGVDQLGISIHPEICLNRQIPVFWHAIV